MPSGQGSLIDRARSMNSKPEPHQRFDAWNHPWPQTPSAVAALVEAYAERLVRYAFRKVGNLHDAEDVVQEVFVRAFANQSRGKGISAVGPYLYRAVANACTDLLRRRHRVEVSSEEIDPEKVLDGTHGPAEAAQAAEGIRRAEAWLGQLPGEQAEAVRLRVFDGLSLKEIAQMAECSVNTVCSRLRYAFQKLRSLAAKQE